jgi:hypothetical protein
MKKTEPEVKLHPRLWQIADVDTYKSVFDIKERLDEHVAAITEQLEEFYARTGTDEDFFEDNPAPNVSTQVYSKWVELKHQYRYQWPNYEYADGYINLTLKINDMLSTHDFDYCLKYFEKKLAELTEKRGKSQASCAMADAISEFQLEKHKKFRGKDNSPITAQDKKRVLEYMSEFLKEDHGWSDEDAAVVLKETKV